MSNIVKYGVKPETAKAVLKVIEDANEPVDRQYISEITGFSLMTAGKAADILVSGGAVSSSRGIGRDAGRKPGMLSPSGALAAVIELYGGSGTITLFSPSGKRVRTEPVPDGGGCAGLFSALCSVSEDIPILCSAAVTDSVDAEGVPFAAGFSDGNVIDTVSAALKTRIYAVRSRADIAASGYARRGSVLYLDAGAKPLPISRLVSSEISVRIGDVSAILDIGASDEEIGSAAGEAALLCGADRLVVMGGSEDLIGSAEKRVSGKLPVEKAPMIDIARIAADIAISGWLKGICLVARK